ncbi:MAG: cobalt transporter CbiM [Synergistaceae bacterium]|jgi:cobalt/nickel transport system permease protein|nr:cobalt transporter CbiM [Synergistaceae bacterium]
MHISEGFLSPQTLAAGWAISGVGIAYGLKKTAPGEIVRTAMLSSAFFLASLVKVDIGPGSAHLSFIAPMGILLAWSAYPAVFSALLLQAVLFRFGGLAVLGVNTASMGTAAVLSHILFGRASRSGSAAFSAAAAFAAGVFGVMCGAALTGTWLVLSDGDMTASVGILLAAHLPVAVIEGAVTAMMTVFLRRTFPDVLKPSGLS